ncbi:hypothetical protein RSAG8_09278, partial [Rhizoctonia solani AG-8 WAC10335]
MGHELFLPGERNNHNKIFSEPLSMFSMMMPPFQGNMHEANRAIYRRF